METLTGIVFDISGYTRENAVGESVKETYEWASSILKVLEHFVKLDVSRKNNMFALGVGAKCGKGFFDIFKLIEVLDKESLCCCYGNSNNVDNRNKIKQCMAVPDSQAIPLHDKPLLPGDEHWTIELAKYDRIVENIFQIVERNGAPLTRKWALKETIQSAIPYETANVLLTALKSSEDFLRAFVSECLPLGCKYILEKQKTEQNKGGFYNIKNNHNYPFENRPKARRTGGRVLPIVKNVMGPLLNVSLFPEILPGTHLYEELHKRNEISRTDEHLRQNKGVFHTTKNDVLLENHLAASTEDISRLVENALGFLLGVSVFSVQRASEILHGCFEAKTQTEDRIKRLMTTVKLLSWGRTRLSEALHKANEIFKKDKYLEHKKLLFVFSDGKSTDNYLSSVSERLKDLRVTVVCFLITRSYHIQPLRLYSLENRKWSNGTKCLFSLSSTISSNLLPRSIFFKTGWNIDITNNQTKLFLQIEQHKNIHDACNLARHIVYCEDLLSDRVLSLSVEKYTNQNIYGFTAKEQVGETCYANASAAIIYMSTRRIHGREGGYPKFEDLREEIINLHGKNGANTLNVLEKICREYRLRCEVIDINDAIRALATGRPVVATFRLNDLEWVRFSQFFKQNRKGILTKADIDISEQGPGGERSGHAVVVTSFNIRSLDLRLLNSWGNEWADEGFFKVQNSEVLDFKFIEVYWTLKDLSPKEIDYFKNLNKAENLANAIKNIERLQRRTHDQYERSIHKLFLRLMKSKK